MLALIKDDTEIVNAAVPEGGTLNIPEILVQVSPALDGWTFENYRLATIVVPDPPAGNYTSTLELIEGVPTMVYTAAPIDDAQIDQQILSAPDDLFGGPTLGEIYNGN
jgi:hypothetical protein